MGLAVSDAAYLPAKGFGYLKDRLEKAVYAGFAATSLFILYRLVAHRSPEPWIFGRYSLPFFVSFLLAIGVVMYVGLLLYKFRRRAIVGLGVLCVAGVVSLAAIEIMGQIYGFFRPSYQSIFLQPDRVLGWRIVPNLEWTWTGHYWYWRDFNERIKANSLGFRDVERQTTKPPGVRRIALLGDSLVEALQVPLHQTAAQVLEKKLNTAAGSAKHDVLNFGTSNFSTGQCLLAWEEHASKFEPDEVFLLLAGFHMNRTTTRRESGFVPPKAEAGALWLRPTFRLDGDSLVREPAKDFDAFVKYQNEQIESEFGGKRSRRKMPGWFLHQHLRRLRHYLKVAGWRLMDIQRKNTGVKPPEETADKPGYFDVDEPTYRINKAILEELNRQVRAKGARLILVDTSDFFKGARLFAGNGVRPLSDVLKEYCAASGIGYFSLSDDMAAAQAKGIDPRWEFDGHFNVAGNEIFADAMYRWLEEHPRPERPGA